MTFVLLYGQSPKPIAVKNQGYHADQVVGPLNLTGRQWSSSEGKAPGEAWALDFGDGERAEELGL